MKQYIRFEEGRQIEVTTLDSKPSGEGWKVAPKNFDFRKIYRLSQSGTVEEIPEEELLKEQFSLQKITYLEELSRIIDRKRSRYIGASEAKRKCYEIQEKAANAVIDNPDSSLGKMIKPLADIRNLTVLEMAELILEKANLANLKIIEAEAIEDKYQDLIQSAENQEEIGALMEEVISKMEDF